MFQTTLALLLLVKLFLKANFYALIIVFTVFELLSKTWRNIFNTVAFKKYEKFANNKLEKFCPWSLASTILVIGFKRVCPRKVGSWP